MTAEDGTSHTGKVYRYYKCFNRKLHKEQCNKSNITKEKMEEIQGEIAAIKARSMKE